MSLSHTGWWSAAATVLVVTVLAGCDVPTGTPSVNTETSINTPLVSEKTFSFLGGPKSRFDPLIDTTSSAFDSLFTVEAESNDISIVQKVDNFDIGTVDGALDNASGELTFDQKQFEETFIDLAEENIVFPGEQRIGDFFSDEELRIATAGNVQVAGSDRVAFKKSEDDYVELGNTTVEVQDFTLFPNAQERVFDRLTYVYPDVRVEPYGQSDQLVVEFVDNPCGEGPCGDDGEYQRDINDLSSGFSIDLTDARVYPDKPNIDQSGSIGFDIAVKINPDLKVEDDDKVGLDISTSLNDVDIQEIKVSAAKPFTINVTPNANGGNIDVTKDNEVRTSSFDGFGGIASRIDGLELADVRLNFQVETTNLASTDAQLYAAIQGVNSTSSVSLGGTEDEDPTRVPAEDRDVSTFPFSTEFMENGTPLPNDSLIRLGITLDESKLGPQTTDLPIDGDNSNVPAFVNTLPTEVRLAGQAEVNTDGGGLRVRTPLELDAGFTLDVPLRIKNTFVVRDTIDADLSALDDLTDPDEDLSVSTAELRFGYTNRLPLGADAKLIVVDEDGTPIETYNENFDDDTFRIKPAPTNNQGAVDGRASGTFVFSLGSTKADLRRLADGRDIRLVLNMTQASEQTAARLRADDTLTLDLKLNADASIQTGE